MMVSARRFLTVNDVEWGKRVHAIVEPLRQGASPGQLAKELDALSRTRLSSVKAPKSYEIVTDHATHRVAARAAFFLVLFRRFARARELWAWRLGEVSKTWGRHHDRGGTWRDRGLCDFSSIHSLGKARCNDPTSR